MSTPLRTTHRSIPAAALALGAAAILAACSSGEGSSPSPSASGSPTAGAASSTGGGSGQSGSSASAAPATAPIDQLALGPAEAPEYSLAVMNAAELADGKQAVQDAGKSTRSDPPECAEVSKTGVSRKSDPSHTAVLSGKAGADQLVLVVTTEPRDAGAAERLRTCSHYTTTSSFSGTEITLDNTITATPAQAPQGVEDFSEYTVSSRGAVAGQQMTQNVVLRQGRVRGVGITVQVSGHQHDVTPEMTAAAERLFAQQAAKIARS